MGFRQTLREETNQFKADLWALSSDPHFQSVLQKMKEARETFWRQASAGGVSQKDQDKFLGAATALDFMAQIIENEPLNPSITPNKGTTP